MIVGGYLGSNEGVVVSRGGGRESVTSASGLRGVSREVELKVPVKERDIVYACIV